MDYGDVVYYQSNNETIYAKLESVQHNAALDITGGIKGLSSEKIYKELSLEYQCGKCCPRYCPVCTKLSSILLLNIEMIL